MTNDEINRAVAMELGWKADLAGDGQWRVDDERWATPNFCYDYNHVAEMRKAVTEREQETFVNCLARVGAIPNGTFDLSDYVWMGAESTPRQQSEAFLRMRGKWVEGVK